MGLGMMWYNRCKKGGSYGMDTEDKVVFMGMGKDIYENQGKNKALMVGLYGREKDVKLKELLYKKLHYFDEGFFCIETPEELDEKIKRCINAKET